MSETEADKEFYEGVEAAFIRRRGTPFLLSPKDFGLLKEWRALRIPLEAVERGIDDAFSRREERGAIGRINSLSYCRDAVLAAWERRAEISVGRGSDGRSDEPDRLAALTNLREHLRKVAAESRSLKDPVEAAERAVARLADSDKSAADTEAALARIDKRLASALLEVLPEPERRTIQAQVEALLERAAGRMEPAAAQKTARALTRRAVRERLGLPRLTLLP
jgi:hypothetical protein